MQNIDLYYESIKQVYDQIADWQEPKPPLQERIVDWLLGIALVAFFLSLIPIFPVIIVYISGQIGWTFGPIDLSGATFGNFILVWGSTTIVFGTLFGVMAWLNNKVDSSREKPTGPPQKLSSEQLTFIAFYESYKQLKMFFVSHVDQHVDKSLKAFRRVVVAFPERFNLPSPIPHQMAVDVHESGDIKEEILFVEEVRDELYLSRRFSGRNSPNSFRQQLSVAQSFLQTFEKYAWFRIDSETKSTLQALISLPEKIHYRLRDREDLATVLSVLENLSNFTYAYLPEHKTYLETETLQKLHDQGMEALKSFVLEVNDLSQYRPAVNEKKPRPKSRSLTFRDKVYRIYCNNIFFRFILWFILILLLTASVIFGISQRIQLDINVMISMVIGTSVTGAAALAVFAPRFERKIRDTDAEGVDE